MRISKKYLKNLIFEMVQEQNLESELRDLVDQNQYIRGQEIILSGPKKNILESDEFLLFFSDYSEANIKERHKDPKKPGSLFNQNINLKDIALDYINRVTPKDNNNTNVNWIAVDNSSNIGSMGLAIAKTEEEFNKLEDYVMPDYKRELVKVKRNSKREPTNKLTMITAKLGKLSNGKEFLSLVTMYPGDEKIDGVQIPAERSDLNKKLIYFITENKDLNRNKKL